MASWTELVKEIDSFGSDNDKKSSYINGKVDSALQEISELRSGKNVIFYASAFLQKPILDPMLLQITNEEINGFMAVMHGMKFDRGLTLILHTPGGMTNATESIVDYLHSKFPYIETIVPTFAMSAGTMISLSSDKIIMGRQSQLGPIDPQMVIGGRSVSARSIVDQFDKAKKDINENITNAHVWAPILSTLGHGLLVEAEKANDYSEKIVESWLKRKGFSNATKIAHHFNSPSLHKSHGKRIDKNEAKSLGLNIEDLEDNQNLQEAVLTAYHAVTIIFEKSPSAKFIISNNGRKRWVKNAPSQINIPFSIPQIKGVQQVGVTFK